MKKIICLLLLILLLVGFGCSSKEKAVITVDNIEITAKEFQKAFDASRFASMGKDGQKAFLGEYISSKLILKQAEKMGLDKDPQFLSDIQFFWEKALYKLILSKKTKELASGISISDKEIGDYYKRYKESNFADKELSQAYGQIKWLLIQEKRNQAMAAWVDSLKAKTHIRIDYKSLGIE